ncbi:tRNA-ribosyltransferase [Burkholderia mayonis]|uniref:tRNA-ribosyltransferase n=1 Tax=Burkholderia mayonis TaxID=1385591 RepID=A0A1B4FQN8_9BURK|nr:tRNA-ribosyltransferase [Burkholderia mayonis]AOJ05974.1 tRNA-ribosyltransferase [Burkholderia mayonis]KVE56960.1 tRNA-ribosyltransferase [Burkholderia mayonis]
MTEIGSYIPHFILLGRPRISQCRCVSCREQPPLVTHAWANHVRHSALLQCDTVSREMLFAHDAFELHEEAAVPVDGAALDVWQNDVNQACIDLLIVDGLSIEERMYAIGVLLNKLSKGGGDGFETMRPFAMANELMQLALGGAFRTLFGQMPAISRYKASYLRRLAKIPFRVSLDEHASKSLNLKLTELMLMSDGFLDDALREIEGSNEVSIFFDKHDETWINYFLYRCFHEVFPAIEREAYGQLFLDLALDYFCVRSLCALLANDVELDEDVVAALFAAWYRSKGRLGRDDHVDPLLVGFSLISREAA